MDSGRWKRKEEMPYASRINILWRVASFAVGFSVRLLGTATTAKIMGFRGKAGQFLQKKGFIGSTPCLLKYSVITRDLAFVMETGRWVSGSLKIVNARPDSGK